MVSKKRILVTGSTGFIGRNLVQAIADDFEVIALGHSIFRRGESPFNDNVQYNSCNLLRLDSCIKYFNNIDVVIHLANRINASDSIMHPYNSISNNFIMCLNILEALRINDQYPLCIFSSTDRVYIKWEEIIALEVDVPYPIEPYTASKILQENLFQIYNTLYNIPYIIFRLDTVYGPYQPRHMFISDIIQKMIKEDQITIGNLNIFKNCIYIDDVISAFIQAINSPQMAWNSIYNIGGNEYISFKEILLFIKAKIESKLNKKIYIKTNFEIEHLNTENIKFVLSIEKAKRMLKWKPKINLEKGIENAVDWFIEHV